MSKIEDIRWDTLAKAIIDKKCILFLGPGVTVNYQNPANRDLEYKKITGKPFPWLFIDPKTLGSLARKGGFSLEVIAWGDHYDYLGILRKK